MAISVKTLNMMMQKIEQAFIEGHIVELENKINTAKIIDESVKG